jgi:hypothetical protein
VRQGTLSTLQIQKVFSDLVEKTTGDSIMTPSVGDYLKDWLTNIKAKNSDATPAATLSFTNPRRCKPQSGDPGAVW